MSDPKPPRPRRWAHPDARADLAWPYDVAADGTTATLRDLDADLARRSADHHLRDLLEQLLLTRPGERVMRPDFGSGLLDLVFEPAGEALAAALEAQAQAVILQHLGDRLTLESLDVTVEDSTLRITVVYRRTIDGRRRVETFERAV
ncbi:MAG: GPW/gp25 family protein [Acidobacteriota bacterium]